MDYSLEDFYIYNYDNEDGEINPKDYLGDVYKESTMEIAKSILVQLESDDELLRDFNFLLRQKKLKQIKKK